MGSSRRSCSGSRTAGGPGLAVDGEAAYNRLMQMMQDIDYHDYARTLDERLAQVDAVTVESLHEHLARHPVAGGGYFVSVGPREWPKLSDGGFARTMVRQLFASGPTVVILET